MSATTALLIVEDNERLSETLAAEFRDRGYAVETATGLAEVRALRERVFDRALVDLRLRQDSGLDAIKLIRESSPCAKIVILTGYGSIATAVKAVKLGVTNYLTKPVGIDDIERAFAADDGDAGEPPDVPPIPEAFPSLARHEREYIEYVLAASEGNITRAAERLGLHRQSLQRKLRKYTPS